MKFFRTACIFSAIAIHGLLLASIPDPLTDVTLDTGGGASSHIAVSVGFQQPASAAAQTATEKTTEVVKETAVTPPKQPTKTVQTVAKDSPVIETKPEPSKESSRPKQAPSPKPMTDIVQQKPKTAEQQPVAEAALASSQTIASGIHHNIITEPLFANSPKPPGYPTIARKRGQQGVVWLDIKLDKDGEQTTVEVFQSSGIRSLDRAALKAVKQWQFLAHKVGSLTVASHIRIPVEFSLD